MTAELEAQPLMQHLIEFRKRLLWVLLTMTIGTVICYFFAAHIY